MEASEFLAHLGHLAPLRLAEEWDNVGLLIAPRKPRIVQRVFLTIDLTREVLDEAIEFGADAIVSYHPPIFSGLKRLLPDEGKGDILLSLIERGLYLYSPHTALDSVSSGINDWLADAFGSVERRAIVPSTASDSDQVGQGRVCNLEAPLSLRAIVERLKTHLGLSSLRVASPNPDLDSVAIGSVALCAGAGGPVVQRVRADLYLTGEMRHHDVLAAVEGGICVVLTEHSNSERGYLPFFARAIAERTRLQVAVSRLDRDPLSVR